MYHMEESMTWLVIRIMHVREKLQFPHTIILPFREVINLSNLASTTS
jgi:hypothetical protein